MRLDLNYRILVLVKLTLILVFSTYILEAQNIKGIVLEAKSSTPLANVNVYIEKTGIGTTTNGKGEFYLTYFYKVNQRDTLIFSCVGYVTRKIVFSELKDNISVVLLSESVEFLDGVIITSKQETKLQIDYTKLASLKVGLYSFGSVLIGGKIWVIGGDESQIPILKFKPTFTWESYSNKMYMYDMQEDKWTTSNLTFSKRAYHCTNYYNDKIYVFGGKTLSKNRKLEYLDDKIEVYDIKHNTILVDKTNPHQAVNFASVVYDGNLIVFGGSTRIKVDEGKDYSKKVHLLNLKTGLWYELGDMPDAKEAKVILVNNTVYLIGGYKSKPLDNIETYNITTGEWEVVGQLFYGVEKPALAFNNNIIYIFENGRFQTYNIETQQLNMYSIDLPLKACELFCANNKLYLLGGYYLNDIPASASSAPELYISPSSDLYSIDLNEFKRAVIYDTKTL